MAHNSRKSIFTLIVLTLCIVFSICVLTACSTTPNDESVTYSVTVMQDENTAAAGVKVTVKKGTAQFNAKTTDENGKVEFSLVADSYELVLSNLPAHYEAPEATALRLTADKTEYTITLVKKFAYTVNLVNPDNTPFTQEGVSVITCTLDGNCLVPVAPENGTALVEAEKGNYHVKVDLPAGYIYENDADGYYVGKNFSADITEMTITIYPITVIDLSKDGMTDAEKTEFSQKPGIYGFNTENPAYKLSKSVAAGEKIYFTLTPKTTGKYNFYSTDTLNYYFNGQTFKVNGAAENALPQYANLEAGKTYYFSAENVGETAVTAESVIVTPISSYIVYSGVGGELELTVGKANTNAIVEFNPTGAGAYKLTVQGNTPAIVETPSYPSDTVYFEPADSDYTVGANATVYYSSFDMAQEYKQPVYFTVTVKEDYPATFTVKIEKIQDSNDSYTYVKVTETLTKYTKEDGTALYGVPMDGSAELVYDKENNVYLYNGKVVVVMITENIGSDRFDEGSALAYLDRNPMLRVKYTVSTTASEGYGINIVDYTRFLRGFKDYELGDTGMQGSSLEIPSTLEENNCYANFVNEDGVYPLTPELKDFLETFYLMNADLFLWQLPYDADLDCGWMFPLYYYDVKEAEATDDPIVGEYKLVSYIAFEISEEDWETKEYTTYTVDGENVFDYEYQLVVYANHTFVLSQYNRRMQEQNPLYSGTWSVTNGVYSFVVQNGTINDNFELVDLHFTVEFDQKAGTIKLVCVEEPSDDQTTEWVFAKKVAENTADSIVGIYTSGNAMIGTLQTLTINADGTYTIQSPMGNTSGTWTKNDDGTYTFVENNSTFGEIPYNVVRDAETGALTFYDEEDPEFAAYEFEPAKNN